MTLEANISSPVVKADVNTQAEVRPITIGDIVSGGVANRYLVVDANGNLGQVELNIHTHDNKAVLDGVTSQKVANWDEAHTWGNHASGGYADASAVSSALNDKVPSSRTITINGTTLDLSQDRSWTITAGASPAGAVGQIQTKASDTALGAAALYYDSANDRLGFRTTTPSQPNHFTGHVLIEGSNSFLFNVNNGSLAINGSTAARILGSVMSWGNTSGISIQKFYASTVEALTLTSVALGVGETSPDTRLDVNGPITQSQSDEPPDPVDGKSVGWTSNGNGMGNAGEVWKKSNEGGTVTYQKQL
jgi:hypothetical protein